MASSSPPSASAEKNSVHAACNGDGGSPPSASDGIQASANRGRAHMSNNSTLGFIIFFHLFLVSFRGFPFIIDFPQHSMLLRILNPRWHAGIFSVPLIFWLWWRVDSDRRTAIRADVVREWVERDTNVHLIRMMGCLAASIFTGDAVELLYLFYEGVTPKGPFDEFGKLALGGFVLFTMVFRLLMTIYVVSLVWRLVWVPVLIVLDWLPKVEAQKLSKRAAEEAKGRSSAVNREGFGHSIHETALDVHGSNRRIDNFSTYLKETLYLGFGIVRNIGVRLFLNDLWATSMAPDLLLQFLYNPRSGRIDAGISGDGSFHSLGDRAEKYKDAELQSRQMKDSDTPDAVSPNPSETEMNDWDLVEDNAGKDEDPSAAPAAPWLPARLVPNSNSAERDCDGNRCRWKLLHDEIHGLAWTRLSDELAAIRNLEDGLQARKVEAQEDEEALSRLDQDACALERGSWGSGSL